MKSLQLLNYKRFQEFLIPIPERELILYGPNNSGKTQIIWAFLLFFRGFNKGQPQRNIHAEIDSLLNYPEMKDLPDYISFLNTSDEGGGEAFFTAVFENQEEVMVKLWANGILTLHKPVSNSLPLKIFYAFMGSSFHFVKKESKFVPGVTPLNSSSNVMRSLYAQLNETDKITINNSMFRLFSTGLTYDQESDTLFCINSKYLQIDVMFMGSGFQKVLGTFILLFYLIQLEGSSFKYFLFEEPEAFLYPSLTLQFAVILRTICQDNAVYLILTTNSQEIVDTAPAESKFALSPDNNQGPGDEKSVQQLIGFLER
jgi:AAA15 family ATPase/GTPase